jgi:acetyltransferase-like isoleucine patch superfamily enzyme
MIGAFSREELLNMGFASLGENVTISRTSTLYNCKNISIGSHVRIDNFCTIAPSGSAQLHIGSYVQISAYCFMNGMGNISLEDFVTFAPFVRLFSSGDDYSGKFLTNATIPRQFLGTITQAILLKKHTIIGVGSSIMPGVVLEEGTAVAGHSFVNSNSKPFTLIGGTPAKYIKERDRNLLHLEKQLLNGE